MGNSEWRYVVPYESDIRVALQRLRAQVFADGAYFKGYDYAEDEVPGSLDELMRRTGARTHSILDIAWIGTVPPPKVPRNQLVLFDSYAVGRKGGLSSPDIPVSETGIAKDGETIYPLTPKELRAIFNTEKPTRWQLAAAEEACPRLIRSHVYIVIYEDCGRFTEDQAQPVQILFYGWSGGGG